ncbi:NAD(P)H-hydrate dehydratase [Candidatus Neomarinimicrobiota bacterium]
MRHVLNSASSKALDKFTIALGNKSEVDLMRNAGRAIAITAARMVSGDRTKSILFVCGTGHNGGDGIAAAGFLKRWGYNCTVWTTGDGTDRDATLQTTLSAADIDLKLNLKTGDIDWASVDLVVDALLGVGLYTPVRPHIADLIDEINGHSKLTLAADVPSGLNSDTGQIMVSAINAAITVTMGYPKLGLLVLDGPDLSGKIEIADIGFSNHYFDQLKFGQHQFGRTDFVELYTPPQRQTYKHQQGKCLVIAGSLGMTGAAILSARSTLLSGSGLTTAACPASLQRIYASAMPELITLPLPDNEQGLFHPGHVPLIRESLDWCNALVMGPGLSRSPQTMDFIREIIDDLDVPTILDADGLTPFNGNLDGLNAVRSPLVITPHAREFALLFDHDLQDVKDNPVGALMEVRNYFHHTVVLKGAPTITLLSTGDIVLNSTGNEGMATAGSGDVLSGIIGTLLSQGVRADEAAIMGVWLHGRAGDLARDVVGTAGMTAHEIQEFIPAALKEFDPPR